MSTWYALRATIRIHCGWCFRSVVLQSQLACMEKYFIYSTRPSHPNSICLIRNLLFDWQLWMHNIFSLDCCKLWEDTQWTHSSTYGGCLKILLCDVNCYYKNVGTNFINVLTQYHRYDNNCCCFHCEKVFGGFSCSVECCGRSHFRVITIVV